MDSSQPDDIPPPSPRSTVGLAEAAAEALGSMPNGDQPMAISPKLESADATLYSHLPTFAPLASTDAPRPLSFRGSKGHVELIDAQQSLGAEAPPEPVAGTIDPIIGTPSLGATDARLFLAMPSFEPLGSAAAPRSFSFRDGHAEFIDEQPMLPPEASTEFTPETVDDIPSTFPALAHSNVPNMSNVFINDGNSVTALLPSLTPAPLASDFFDLPPPAKENENTAGRLYPTGFDEMIPMVHGSDYASPEGEFVSQATSSPASIPHPVPANSSDPPQRASADKCTGACRYLFSFVLLGFAATLTFAAMATSQTTGTQAGLPPLAAMVALVCLLLWLATIEGGQGCLVGLQRTDKQLYAATHPMTHRCAVLVHRGDNMERFILGRQLLVVIIVFAINYCASAGPASVFGLPGIVQAIFLGNGIALILLTVMMGQLTAQVSAATSMLDFTNNGFLLLCTYLSLGIEATGLLHCTYAAQFAIARISGTPKVSAEAPLLGWRLITFGAK